MAMSGPRAPRTSSGRRKPFGNDSISRADVDVGSSTPCHAVMVTPAKGISSAPSTTRARTWLAGRLRAFRHSARNRFHMTDLLSTARLHGQARSAGDFQEPRLQGPAARHDL